MTNDRLGARLARSDLACLAAIILALPLGFDIPVPVKVIALLAAMAVVIWGGPVAGLSLVCAALSVAALIVQIGGTEWSPLELALLACGAATGLAILLDLFRNRRISTVLDWIGPRDVALLGAGILIVGCLSLLWVADPDLRPDSLRSLRRVIIEPLFVIPAMAAVVRGRETRRIAGWIVGPALAVSLLALVQLALQRSTVDICGIARPIGTFTHPNNVSFYLERAVWFTPLVVVPLASRLGRWPWLIAGLIVLATLATLSRGAAIALAAGCVVMFWELIRSRWRAFLGVVVAGAAVVFASRYVAQTGDSIDTRTTIWRAAVDMVRDHPVTGVGLDQFLGQYGRRYVRPDGWPERYTSHPHNVVLDFWLSLGLAGLALLWLWLEIAWRHARASLNAPNWSAKRAGAAMIIAGLAHGLIDNSFFLPYLATLTWIGLSISAPWTPEVTGD
jgi:O-antigen ligase